MTPEIKQEIKQWVEDILSDKEVETVSMGGMGEGYENAIQQIILVSLAKIAEDDAVVDEDDFSKYIDLIVDSVVHKLNDGYSGSQVGASKNFVSVVFRNGVKSAFDKMRESDPERIIKRNQFGVINYKD